MPVLCTKFSHKNKNKTKKADCQENLWEYVNSGQRSRWRHTQSGTADPKHSFNASFVVHEQLQLSPVLAVPG